MTIAALFVERDGPYADLSDIECWDVTRDARLYRGPHRVIAHPPCARWGRYWSGGPSYHGTKVKGDDGGCFSAALWAVRTFGGVIEHPEGSAAWPWFGLKRPPRLGGWISADDYGGLTCCVEQGHYGHAAAKATWLYYKGNTWAMELTWGRSGKRLRLDDGFHSAAERRRLIKTEVCQRLSRRQRRLTPPMFRDVLIQLVSQ